MIAPRPAHAAVPAATRGDAGVGASLRLLRTVVVVAGLCWSVLFVLLGLGFELQLYGDGAIFSYAIAVEEPWAIHWHNISERLFVYLYASVPAEAYVALTGSAYGGIVVYGALFFGAPLLGLIATFLADRSQARILFAYACFSTACLCPLVFGFPTEMWLAHAVFWPALAVCHQARRGIGGSVLVFAALLALAFTHLGGLLFAIAILSTLLLRRARDGALRRATIAFLAVAAIWTIVTRVFPPDDYDAPVIEAAALHFFDPRLVIDTLVLVLLSALAAYGVLVLVARRWTGEKASLYATAAVAIALAAYWLRFDHALHADTRYYVRTVLFLATPPLGALACVYALMADGVRPRFLPRLATVLADDAAARVAIGAFLLTMLVHAVETAKFVTAWTAYKSEIRALAMGPASDPLLGNPRFVSSQRIYRDLDRLAWSSTTPFLSVLVAPAMMPARLVIDPAAGYFWLSCALATANENAHRAVPMASRQLVRVHECQHR